MILEETISIEEIEAIEGKSYYQLLFEQNRYFEMTRTGGGPRVAYYAGKRVTGRQRGIPIHNSPAKVARLDFWNDRRQVEDIFGANPSPYASIAFARTVEAFRRPHDGR
ncbi:hypothetical protein LAV_00167 [Sphingobium phage Lacusarx]|uniref:Uncharacterized protein n=1 Tax=Sphingobium phage Lacusarx TaxID=1980139 RepID=A0A1W6DXP6_9CAUD|nr:hypothetical protein FDH44_gp136 [Sphingobium phage Lacusarx]ARK07542.1 hypothetical protein LAV_00167 [Sphingobium phage Lacusarx]